MKILPARLLPLLLIVVSCTSATTVRPVVAQQPAPAPQPATAPKPAPPSGAAVPASATRPPIGKDSVKFLVLGDTGVGDRAQYDVAEQAWKSHSVFPYEFVIMLGDNMYGSERPQDFSKKFEVPYKPLLDANIPFYAALGNHDDPNQRYYKPFGMGGQRFYSFQKPNVRFFVLDSNYMDKDQQAWLEKELAASNSKWKIAYCHHPLYSSGGRHGSEVDLRAIIEPMFMKYGVNVVFAGHEHFYERLKPQNGIAYFTAGGSAKLREGDIRTGPLTAKGFDTEQSYMLIEIDGDVLRFQTLSRHGKLVDSGEVKRQEKT
jgi:predicted phosphodiesterase